MTSRPKARDVPTLAQDSSKDATTLTAGRVTSASSLLANFLQPADRLAFLSAGNTEILIDRIGPGGNRQKFLHAAVGCVGQPKESASGGFLIRVDLPTCKCGPQSLFLSGDAVRKYFYPLDGDGDRSLYEVVRTGEAAPLEDLRMSWRLRNLEMGLDPGRATERLRAERAFNLLANPDLRNCYDSLLRDRDAPPLFPYGGYGTILVEGRLSGDGEAFFADRILAYKPDMVQRKVSLLLRRCEFADDRMICCDQRRKLEVWIDRDLLPGVSWDLTWNQWRHWLRSRIEVEATFVSSGKYLLRNGEWLLRKWLLALPSRIRLTPPEGIAADIARARAIHSLLGEHAAVVERVRSLVDKEPIEHSTIQGWFDQVNVSRDLKPQHVSWHPDYEPYYFEQLRERSRTWFLFRNEFIFVLPLAVIAEVPQPGYATYVFAAPDDLHIFLAAYATATRDDVRRNRNDVATRLGFIGRVVRGHRPKRWLADVLRKASQKADYVEALD